jgi:hypothetical protein
VWNIGLCVGVPSLPFAVGGEDVPVLLRCRIFCRACHHGAYGVSLPDRLRSSFPLVLPSPSLGAGAGNSIRPRLRASRPRHDHLSFLPEHAAPGSLPPGDSRPTRFPQ